MKSHTWDSRILTLLIALCLTPQARALVTTFHASNPNELIIAIQAANDGASPAVIRVSPGTYQFTQAFPSDYGPSQLPPISSNVTLIGGAAATTILSGVAMRRARMFTVVPGGRLTVRKMTVTAASAATDFNFPSNFNGGGAVGNFGGFLRFQDCVLSRNTAGNVTQTSGGAIVSVEGRLEIIGTTLTHNFVVGAGGAIALIGGSGLMRDSTVAVNDSSGLGRVVGGGIFVSGTLAIYNSTIARNSASSTDDDSIAEGAGIWNLGSVQLVNSAVVENVSGGPGVGSGGGIFNHGFLAIKNGTVGGNEAGTSGGGIFNSSTLRLQGVTVARNAALGRGLGPDGQVGPYPDGCDTTAPQLCITGGGGLWTEPGASTSSARSALAGNSIIEGRDIGPDCAGVLNSKGHNLLSNGADCQLKGSNSQDLIGRRARLDALEDDGDPGSAHFPVLADSPLIDAGGPAANCTAVDQIGQRRVDGDHDGRIECDIGAIEAQP
jgi:hypothetical protein